MLWSTQNSNDFLLEKNLENYFDKPPINPYCFGYIIYIYIFFSHVFPSKVPFLVPLSIFTLGALTFQHGKVKDLEEPQVAKQVQHPLAVPLGPGCGISIALPT